jgi:hypothetical protein
VLDAWAASPSRFREDANAEADAVTGGYRDRLVVELAQNAVDAGGSRLWLRLEGDVLLAANDGARLSADGVLGLSTLRASAKRSGQTVGRYGVGFAAVLAVSDAPEIGSRGLASVQWSAERSRELAAQVVGPELAARGGHVPILRLPFEGPPLDVPAGYDTLVRLPLRDPALARRLLEEFDPTLPLVLPGLLELRVGDREIRCQREGSVVVLDGVRWASASLHGVATPELMVGRPPEERPEWTVTAYAPISSTLPTPQALRAPTPTDEPLSLPVVLAATVPLEPTRRRLVPGPLAEHVLAAGGAAIAALLPTLDDPLPLIPTGLAAGAVDASVRTALLAALPGTAVLAGSAVLDLGPATEAVTALLAGTVAGLLPPSVLRHPAALSVLGIRRLTTADVVDLLAQSARSPAQWREVYSALADAPDRDALGALPVPLADGRVVTGCRGALLPDGPLPPEVAGLPLRVVHPQAAHPLLERLGAVPATAAGLLEDPALRAACEEAEDYDESLARGVCALVEAAGAAPAWVGETLLLPAERGAEVAGDLLWPGGLLDRAGADLPRLDPPAWLEERTARAAGVLDAPTVLTAEPPADWPFEVRPAETTLLSDLDLAEDLPALLAGRPTGSCARHCCPPPTAAGGSGSTGRSASAPRSSRCPATSMGCTTRRSGWTGRYSWRWACGRASRTCSPTRKPRATCSTVSATRNGPSAGPAHGPCTPLPQRPGRAGTTRRTRRWLSGVRRARWPRPPVPWSWTPPTCCRCCAVGSRSSWGLPPPGTSPSCWTWICCLRQRGRWSTTGSTLWSRRTCSRCSWPHRLATAGAPD